MIVGFVLLFIVGYAYMFMLMCTYCTRFVMLITIIASFGIMALFYLQVPIELQRRVDKYCPSDLKKETKCISYKMDFLEKLQPEHPLSYLQFSFVIFLIIYFYWICRNGKLLNLSAKTYDVSGIPLRAVKKL